MEEKNTESEKVGSWRFPSQKSFVINFIYNPFSPTKQTKNQSGVEIKSERAIMQNISNHGKVKRT